MVTKANSFEPFLVNNFNCQLISSPMACLHGWQCMSTVQYAPTNIGTCLLQRCLFAAGDCNSRTQAHARRFSLSPPSSWLQHGFREEQTFPSQQLASWQTNRAQLCCMTLRLKRSRSHCCAGRRWAFMGFHDSRHHATACCNYGPFQR